MWDDVNPNWANALTKRDAIKPQATDKDDELEIALALNRTVLVDEMSSYGRPRQISGGTFLDL